MTTQTPSIGRIVHYTLGEGDVDVINRHVPQMVRDPKAPTGERVRRNSVSAGDVFPAVIIRHWSGTCVNLQVLLDGDCSYWATSRTEGDHGTAGRWAWPPRV